jgi:3',5'-cyclic AMP phosphodiesterase CpdA
MHISDLHTGWHFDRTVAEQLVRQAHDIAPDLIVVSGDLVIRADFTNQWRAAAELLRMLPHPQLVVPGNHDISLFNGFYRLFAPLKRYRRYITNDINPVFAQPGLAVIGGCSAHGLTIDGGRLYPNQIATLDNALGQFGDDTFKILVLHHHIVSTPGIRDRSSIANAHAAIHLMEKHKVNMFLCGHVHVSYVVTTRGRVPNMRQDVIISQCGTTTSRRGRGQDKRKNSFHLITIDDYTTHIVPHSYQDTTQRFVPLQEYVFQRSSSIHQDEQERS